MHLNPPPRTWLLRVFMLTFLAYQLVPAPAWAQDRVHRFIQYTVQDPDGNFFPIGEVEFCTPDGNCLYADIEDDFPGHFIVPSQQLEAGVAYTVRIYDLNVSVHFEMRNWTYIPRNYDPAFDRFVDLDKFLVYPRFKGQDGGGLTFRLDTTLNPEWALRKNLPKSAGPDSTPDFPELIVGFQVPFMLGGKFKTEQSAIGGVDDVRPGLGLSGTLRFGYPDHMPARDHWVFFQEITFAYQQNRYETWEIITPGRRSDVTFHRVKLSYGLGQMTQSYGTHWSVGVTAAYGGIYDGIEKLKYVDRSYSRSGFGVKASALQRIFKVGRVDVGVNIQAELMYYFADNGPDDYWFGVAPSASFGLVVF